MDLANMAANMPAEKRMEMLSGVANIGNFTSVLKPLLDALVSELNVDATKEEMVIVGAWLAEGDEGPELMIMPCIMRQLTFTFEGKEMCRPVNVRDLDPINVSEMAKQAGPMVQMFSKMGNMGKGA